MEKYMVRTENLKKYYRLGENTVRALDGVDFGVRENGSLLLSSGNPEAGRVRCFI